MDFGNLDNEYLEKLNPIRILESNTLTKGHTQWSGERIIELENLTKKNFIESSEDIEKFGCHVGKFIQKIMVYPLGGSDKQISEIGIGSTERTARFAAAKRMLQKLRR